MSAIKPESYIAYLKQCGNIKLRSEVFISKLEPIGNANVKPQTYITIIPSTKIYTKAKAATKRKVGHHETAKADTLREIGSSQSVNADTFRQVKKFEIVHGDTSRKIGLSEVHADTLRNVKNICEFKADTIRKLGIREKIFGATSRSIKIFERIHGDTQRVFGAYEIINADTSRSLIEKIFGTTVRKIVRPEKVYADTVIRIPHKMNYVVQSSPMLFAGKSKKLLADSAPSLINTFKNCNVTSFSISLQEKTLSDTFEFQAAYNFNINDAIIGQLLNYKFNFLVEEINQQGIVQTVKGMYNRDKLLYTRLRDATYTIEHRQKKKKTGHSTTIREITYYSAGCHLDNIAQLMGFTANMKFDDFIPYNISDDSNTTYASYLSSIFGWTSKVPQRQINVFIRGDVLCAIQRGYEESVFDITDIPHSVPSFRKKILRTMWQSGDYEEIIDDADDEIDLPSGEWGEVEIVEPFSGTISFSDEGTSVSLKYQRGLLVEENHSAKNSSSTTTYSYKEVFSAELSEIEIFMQNLTGDFYLESKHTHSYTYQSGEKQQLKNAGGETDEADTKKINTWSDTEYIYSSTNADDIYLVAEKESTETVTWGYKEQSVTNSRGKTVGKERGWEQTSAERHSRKTYHEPLGNGWYGQSVYVDGEAVGSNVSQGKPGNKVSPYTINEVRKTFTRVTINPDKDADNPGTPSSGSDDYDKEYKAERAKLAPTTDVSFPVREFQKLYELTEALIWLDRKTQEEVSVDIIDTIVNGTPTLNHIVDFTERVMLDGVEYFLVSNQVKLAPKKFVQSLRLIRWY